MERLNFYELYHCGTEVLTRSWSGSARSVRWKAITHGDFAMHVINLNSRVLVLLVGSDLYNGIPTK